MNEDETRGHVGQTGMSPRVKISTNAKGEAQVEVSVYGPQVIDAVPKAADLKKMAKLAADAKLLTETYIRKNGGALASDYIAMELDYP